MITHDGVDMVARGSAMEEVKPLASAVHFKS